MEDHSIQLHGYGRRCIAGRCNLSKFSDFRIRNLKEAVGRNAHGRLCSVNTVTETAQTAVLNVTYWVISAPFHGLRDAEMFTFILNEAKIKISN